MGFEQNPAMGEHAALLVMDMQVDFCPGGSLAVPEGDTIAPLINRYVELFSLNGLPVYATRDWHPAETSHFSRFGGLWPPHCVQGSKGAEFHPALRLPDEVIIVSKGMDPHRDDYSPLQVTEAEGITFAEQLKKAGVSHIFLCGLATDYCIKWTTLDGLRSGFRVSVLRDAVKGVDFIAGDSERALEEMVWAGAEMLDLDSVEKMDLAS